MKVLALPRPLFDSEFERAEATFQRISSSSYGGILGGHLLQVVANQGCKRSVTISRDPAQGLRHIVLEPDRNLHLPIFVEVLLPHPSAGRVTIPF